MPSAPPLSPQVFDLLIFVVPALTALMALFLSASLIKLVLYAGPVDQPRHRGNHVKPTPTSAGLAVMVAMALTMALIFRVMAIDNSLAPQLIILFLFSASMGIAGGLDDWLGLSARLKLIMQIIPALIFALWFPVTSLPLGLGVNVSLWLPVAVAGTALWFVVILNAVNFMDGANGLAPGYQAQCFGVLILAVVWLRPESLPLGHIFGFLVLYGATFGAHMGLIPFNLTFGKVFQGDAGSFFASALIAGSIPILSGLGIISPWFGGYLLLPILVDTSLTLYVRSRRKERLFEAHRQHLYQVWIRLRDPSHENLSTKIWGLGILSSALGLISEWLVKSGGSDIRFFGLGLMALSYGYVWLRLRQRLEAQ